MAPTNESGISFATVVVCLVLFVLGLSAGLVIHAKLLSGPSERVAASDGARANDARFDEIHSDIQELSASLARRTRGIPTPMRPTGAASRGSSRAATDTDPANGSDKAHGSGDPALDRLDDLQRELDKLSRLVAHMGEAQRQIPARIEELMALAAGAVDRPLLEPGVPPGSTTREYFAALKQVGGDPAAAHRLWSSDRIHATYGAPDEIVEREAYIEWIYKLSESTQFDFHFVNDLCVEAH